MFELIKNIERVIIICGRTDMRCGIDRLSAIIRFHYGLDPLEAGSLFLFCGRKTDRIKGLIYNGTGFCLVYIRLTDGKFQWPRNSDEARDISPEQYRRFMDGFAIDSSIKKISRIEP